MASKEDPQFPGQTFLHRRTLIVGDVKSGKTERTLKILKSLMAGSMEPTAVLDFAPEKISGVGGKIPLSAQDRQRLDYFSPRILAPRLMAKTPEEAWKLAAENARQIHRVPEEISKKNYRVVIIFHTQTVADLFSVIGSIPTMILNGYHGRCFRPGELSRREREQMNSLLETCDQVFFLPSQG